MSRTVTAGLVLLALLALADVPTVLLTDGEHPPLSIAVLGTVLGLVSLVLLVPAWRGSRGALGGLVALRLLSALSAVPAFVVDGVPAPVRLLATAAVLLTVVGCALVVPALRHRSPATA